MDMKRKDNPIAGVLSRLTLILAIFLILFGVIVLIGWIANSLQIARIGARFIPMAPSTALCFTLLGAVLLCRRWQSHNRSIRSIWQALTGIVLLFNIAIFIQFTLVSVTDLSLDIERWFTPAALYEQGFVIGRMSSLTALLFILFSSATLLSSPFAAMQAARDRVAQSFVMAVLIFAGILAVGYWYGTPLLYGGTLTPVALTTDIGFILLSSGFLFEGSNGLLTRWMLSTSVFDRFTRLVLPGIIGINLLVGWVHLTILAQLSPVYGVLSFSLSALFSAGLVTFLTIMVARQVQTEVTQAEQALVRSHDLLNLTGQMAKVGGWELDVESQTLSWTEEVYRIHEVDPATHLDIAEAINFYSPQAQPIISAAVQAGIDSGTPWDIELPLITAQGRRIWARAQGAAEQRNGKTVRIFGAFQDITERKQVEEEIRSLARFPSENPNPILRIARNGTLLYINNAGLSQLQEWNLQNGETVPVMLRDAVSQSLDNGSAHEVDLEQGGRAYSLSFAPIVDSGYTNLYIHDITERRRAEQALQTYTAKLEQSNRDLQEFAYVASHDLQEPLRKVQAFSDRLATKYESVLDETGRDYLKRMRDASHRMQVLITDLLGFSRISTHAQPFTEVDLNTITQEVLSDLENHIERIQARVEVGQLPMLKADPTQMHQLLQNLISNALKFHAEERPCQIKISSKIEGETCQVSIEDNGIGFEAQYLERIFKPFQRLHKREEYEGSGMGLAICRRIVERHGGSITATSASGQGTTFLVSLPIHPKEKNDDEASHSTDHHSDGGG